MDEALLSVYGIRPKKGISEGWDAFKLAKRTSLAAVYLSPFKEDSIMRVQETSTAQV